MQRNKPFNSVFGYEYVSFCKEKNTVIATLHNISFQTTNMIRSEKGTFVGLYAEKEITSKDILVNFKKYLDKRYGKGKKIQGSFNKTVLQWESSTFLIQIPIDKKQSYEEIGNLTFFMLNKKFKNETKLIRTGEWISLIHE